MSNEIPIYWESAVPNPRGIFIVAPGLNVKPSKMGTPLAEGTLVKLLLDLGYHVYRVTLPGYAGEPKDAQKLSHADWISDAYSQYCQARAIAENRQLPLYLLGFSLGALVYLALMAEETEMTVGPSAAGPVKFEKIILFSPAIAIKPVIKLMLHALSFVSEKIIIRSASPKEYRAQNGISLAVYKAVFEMEELLCSFSFKNCNINTILFIDRNDEMLSINTLNERIIQYGLNNWKIYEISNANAAIKPQYHHLLIDSKCVSSETWRFISGAIMDFLN